MDKKITDIRNELKAADETKLPLFVENYKEDERSGVQSLVARAKNLSQITKKRKSALNL